MASSPSRVYVCILDELDPSGPPAPQGGEAPPSFPSSSSPPLSSTTGRATYEGKPPPIGERILPAMQIESSIGQEGEHVLRNVAKVERFVVDLLRSAIVDELVYPNFHTILLG